MRTLFHGWKAAASKVQPRSTYHRLIVCTHHVQQTQSLSLSKYTSLYSHLDWSDAESEPQFFPLAVRYVCKSTLEARKQKCELLILTKQICATS